MTHTAAKYVPKFREVVFSQYPFLKSLGLAAFGKKAMLGETSFGDVTKSSGKGITFNQGGYQFEFPIMTSAPSSYHVGYFDNINPQHNDPGNGGAYSWDRFVVPVMIPEEFMLDNVGSARLMNRFKTEMELAQRTAMRDLSYIILGHASAPTGAPEGLSQLVSVTQTAVATGSPGGLSPADYSWWNNQAVSCTSVGGGGEVDRPLQLIRSMEKLMLTCRNLSGASNDQTLVGTAGAWQYYGRARYADQTANGVPALRNSSYDAIDVDHLVFAGRPFIYDAAVTGPIGATASTESIYFLDYSEFGVNFKANEYFKVEGWEAPRAHDNQRFYQMNIWYRLVPYVTNRRIQGVLYSIPANSDAAATAATIPT
ncbi:MAG TPA: phage major capsid protein [Phycisphaerae bacterium]|nr:phage major capsid protein [Phycisphaerae bacterium]